MPPQAAIATRAPAALRRGLECRIGRWRFGVPVEAVQQVIDLELGPPPPLATPWLVGVGLHEGRALLAVGLFSSTEAPARRTAKGIWLAVDGAPTDFLLEVSRVEGFVDADVQRRRLSVREALLPPWVTAAVSAARPLGWIHAGAMLRALSSGEATP